MIAEQPLVETRTQAGAEEGSSFFCGCRRPGDKLYDALETMAGTNSAQ